MSSSTSRSTWEPGDATEFVPATTHREAAAAGLRHSRAPVQATTARALTETAAGGSLLGSDALIVFFHSTNRHPKAALKTTALQTLRAAGGRKKCAPAFGVRSASAPLLARNILRCAKLTLSTALDRRFILPPDWPPHRKRTRRDSNCRRKSNKPADRGFVTLAAC